MSLSRPHSTLLPELDYLFEGPGFWRRPLFSHPDEARSSARMMQPRMDLYENADKNLTTATFELPGLSKENVQMDIQNGNLVVSGESSTSSEQEEHGFAVKERKFGRFVRTVKLPEGTKPKDIKASMENGILTVTYPKSSPGQGPQRITID